MLAKPPNASNGEADGPAAPEAPPGPTLANVGAQARASAGPAIEAHLTGEPDALPITWCKKCRADVKPEGKGRCPRCQTFLRLNFSRRKHPVNVMRRDALLKKLVADYRPSTTLLMSTCEMLAGILEQLEALRPGSPEHQRLVQLSRLLGAALEESCAREIRTQTDFDALSLDELVERATSSLRTLLDLRDDERKGEALIAAATADYRTAAGLPVLAPTDAAADVVVLTPAPAPDCPYCKRACVGMGHVAYEVLHWSDPTEVAKRDDRATKEMLAQIGKPFPEWYR